MFPGYDYYENRNKIPVVGERLTPVVGEQSNVVFRVSEFERVETFNLIHYDITFEVECDLYFGSDSRLYDYFGRLDDGVFRTKFSVPK